MFQRLSLRFSLRTLLVAVLFFGVLAGFAARIYRRGERQRQIVNTAKASGAHFEYDFEHYKDSRWYAPARWLAPRLGADQVGNVHELRLSGTQISRWRPLVATATELSAIKCFNACSEDLNTADLQQLAKFKQLEELGFAHVHELPNLQPLAGLQHLQQLKIHGRGVTAANFKPLQSLPKLRILNLANTDATDDIIPLLASLPHLKELYVDDTDIKPAALAGLKNAKSLKILHIHPGQLASETLPGIQVVIE